MSNYKIRIKKLALKELARLPRSQANLVSKKINQLSVNPRPRGCKKLKNHEGMWRVRSGNYRIIYQIEDSLLILEILKIADRKEVY